MKSNALLKYCLYVIFCCAPLLAIAEDSLQFAIQKFIEERIQGKNNEVTVKLKTPATLKDNSICENAQIFLPPGAKLRGKTLVGINCTQGNSPIFVNADIRITAKVLVANRPLHAKSQIDRSNLIEKKVDITNYAYGVITDYEQISGKITKRPLPSGLPIRLDDLQSNEALTAGETVNVLYIGQGFKVATQGKVISSADLGQYVQVRMMSGQIINGVVKPQKTVEISL